MSFDMAAVLRAGVPEGESRWAGDLPYNFVGGHNDPVSVPFAGFAEAAVVALSRHGTALARYNLGGSPQGHLPLREFVADALGRRAHMPTDPDEILVTSGSLQALDLVCGALLAPGDVVVVEEATYAGTLQPAGRTRRRSPRGGPRPWRDPPRPPRGDPGVARRTQAPPQVHLHDPHGAEPHRHRDGSRAPARPAGGGPPPRRGHLRGRLLRRPGRSTGRARPRSGRWTGTTAKSSTADRSPRRWHPRCGWATSWPIGR